MDMRRKKEVGIGVRIEGKGDSEPQMGPAHVRAVAGD